MTTIEQLPLQLSIAGAHIMRASVNQAYSPAHGVALCKWYENTSAGRAEFVVWNIWLDTTTGQWNAEHGDYFLFAAHRDSEDPEKAAFIEALECYRRRAKAAL